MGKRKQFGIFALACILRAFGFKSDVYAYSTEDLFHKYSVEYEGGIEQEILDTISAYECAKSYVAKFSNLLSLEPDLTTVVAQVSSLEEQCQTIELRLSEGYFLTYDELIALEDEHSKVTRQLEQAKSTLSIGDIDLQLSFPEVPSAPSYAEAVAMKDKYIAENYLGELDFVEPIKQFSSSYYDVTNFVHYSGTWGASVYSMYNAHCTAIQATENGLLIELQVGDYVTLTYTGILYSKIQIDDYITQGDLIGLAGDSLYVQLVLDDTPIDFSKEGTAK